MLIKSLSILTIAAAAGLVSTMAAEASPRFTVTNKADKMVKIFVFNGDDSGCHLEEKVKTIDSGHSNTMGCSGNGKGRCKIYLQQHGERICKSQFNTCGNDATKIDNGGTVTTWQDGDKVKCTFSK